MFLAEPIRFIKPFCTIFVNILVAVGVETFNIFSTSDLPISPFLSINSNTRVSLSDRSGFSSRATTVVLGHVTLKAFDEHSKTGCFLNLSYDFLIFDMPVPYASIKCKR